MRLRYIAAGLLALAGGARGQDEKPVSIGGFDTQGSVAGGFRLTDIDGYEAKYLELVNLQSGFRILDFSLFGKAAEANRFADSYSLTTSGLGGEPFSTTQFSLRKKQAYEVRANFRQSRYYWNRNDQAALPSNLNGLTSNHDWATVRKLGSVNVLGHATKNLRVSFEYFRNTRSGMSFTTRPLEYFGAPPTWAAFARANPYYMAAPLDEAANRVTGGIDYSREKWSVHYRLGYQDFKSAIAGSNTASPQRSINIDDPNTSRELLNGAAWKDSRQLKTPVSEFSYTGRLTDHLAARGGYIFYRYSGPASLDTSFDGLARTTSAAVVGPYDVSFSSQAEVTEPNHVIDQGFTYEVKNWWDILLDYRYSRFTVDSRADFQSTSGGTTLTGSTENEWRIGTHVLDLNMAFTPAASLLVRTGLRLMKSDVVALEDGVTDPQRTKRINTAWPVVSVYYQPSRMLTIRADVDQINNGTSYTRITPHIDNGARFVVRFKPLDNFYIEDTAIIRNRTLLQTDYRSTIRNNSAMANYDWNDKISIFAGFSYDSYFATNFVNFLRGTTPFTNLSLRDQTVDRVWQGGIRATPLPGVGFNFSGNFIRTTGAGEIYGEAPLYGPMSFPYATLSVYGDVPRMGRLSLQLQRTYYTEEIVPGNNFSANLLTIGWTKGF